MLPTEYITRAAYDRLVGAITENLLLDGIASDDHAAIEQARANAEMLVLGQTPIAPDDLREHRDMQKEAAKDFAHELETFADGVGSADRLVKHARQVIEHGDHATKAGDEIDHWTAKVTGVPRRGLTVYQSAEAVMSRLQAG